MCYSSSLATFRTAVEAVQGSNPVRWQRKKISGNGIILLGIESNYCNSEGVSTDVRRKYLRRLSFTMSAEGWECRAIPILNLALLIVYSGEI